MGEPAGVLACLGFEESVLLPWNLVLGVCVEYDSLDPFDSV